MDAIEQIKKNLKSKNMIVGTKKTMKQLTENKLSAVFLSSNVPRVLKEEINKIATVNNVAVNQLAIPNDELGVVCKKPYSVSMISLVKGAN